MRRVQVPVLRVRGFDSHRVYIFFCRCLVRTYCTSKYFRRAILCDSHSLPPCLYGLAHQQCNTTKTTTALCTEILGQKASCCREHCAAERRRDGIVTHVAYVCMCRERPTAMSGLHAHRVLLWDLLVVCTCACIVPGTLFAHNFLGVYCASILYYIYPTAERLGYGPYPRHGLAVLLSPDTANACSRLFSCTPSYFLCDRHLCVGHDLMERCPRYAVVQVLQKDFFCWRSAVVHPYLFATSTKPVLRRRGQYTVQYSAVITVQ